MQHDNRVCGKTTPQIHPPDNPPRLIQIKELCMQQINALG
jgi:hypothetical protein